MKKIILLTFIILGVTTINSCKIDKEQELVPNNSVTAEKTNAKTYEIINLIAHGNLVDRYNATFGSATIELLKTSDSTLTFFVPDVSAGEHLLDFDLSKIKFNVTRTKEVDSNQLASSLFQSFDSQVSVLNPTTTEEIADVDSTKKFKQEVLTLFNSLSTEQKRQTALFYEANKDLFKSFSNGVSNNLKAATVFRLESQSDCPQTDFKSFYGCTAQNLGNSATDLRKCSRKFLEMIGMSLAMGGTALSVTGPLGPIAWGITVVGMSLPLGMAGYLLITETGPSALRFAAASGQFLNANWIFTKGLFLYVTKDFLSDVSTDTKLDAKFRTLSNTDTDVNSGTSYFIGAMSSLTEYWNKLSAIFGRSPSYKNNEKSVSLSTSDISISNISNSKVQLVSQSGEQLKFKSLSGKEETFNYDIRVTKEGFIEEKSLNAKVLAVPAIDIVNVTIIPNKFFPNETSGFVHSNSIDLEIDIIGTPQEFAIVPATKTPTANDWITTIPIQNKITYNYQASFDDMTIPGVWDLIIYIKSGEKTVNKPIKIRYTTIVPHTSVIDKTAAITSVVNGIPSSLVIPNVFIHTYIEYHDELLNLCSINNSFSSFYMIYKDGTGKTIAPFPNITYGRVRFYDINGNVIEDLIPAPFSFYNRRCVSKGDNSYHLKIAYAEIFYNNY